jgi:hypothetical protein
MRKRLLIFICLYFVLNGYSQGNRGYYNSRFYVSLDALVNSPLIYNFRSKNFEYSRYDKNLMIKSDKLNYGFRANIAMLFKRNFAFGIEGGVDYGNIYLNKSLNYQNDLGSYEIQVILEKLDIKTVSFIPKIEFSTKNSLLPLGLSHQFGFGVNYTKLIEKNYASASSYTDFNYSNSNGYVYNAIYLNDFSAKLFDYKNQQTTKNFTFLYALSMKTALTKNILLNYGFRYTLNFHQLNIMALIDNSSSYDSNNITNGGYYVSQKNISDLIYRQRFSNLINFNLGLTYAF